MNKIRICNKCKAVDHKVLIEEIKKIDKSAIFAIGCQNMCGIGRNKPFAIVNNKPIIGDNTTDLIDKITKILI